MPAPHLCRQTALCILVVFGLMMLACRPQSNQSITWFVHVTDPHFFEEIKMNRQRESVESIANKQLQLEAALEAHESRNNSREFKAILELSGEISTSKEKVLTLELEQERKRLERKEQLNEIAFEHLLAKIKALKSKVDFLVLTGDIGIDDSFLAATGHEKQNQIKKLLGIFSESSVDEIFFVPGNNDVKDETPSEGLQYTQDFFSEIKKGLKKDGINFHYLYSCYAQGSNDLGGCYNDLEKAKLRLIGFPSHSFKNKGETKGEEKMPKYRPEQGNQLLTFQKMLQSTPNGYKTIALSHIPPLDDPYFKAQKFFDEKSWNHVETAWHLDQKVTDVWEAIQCHPKYLAMLAGHLHDSHKEVYRDYAWSSHSSPEKLFVAPPIAFKNQLDSIVQARGFSLMSYDGHQLKRCLYWYDQENGTFHPEHALDCLEISAPSSGRKGFHFLLAVLFPVVIIMVLDRVRKRNLKARTGSG